MDLIKVDITEGVATITLDDQTRRKFQEDLLTLLREEGRTVLFVTHSTEEAAYLSDRIVLLSPRPARVVQVIDTIYDRSSSHEAIRRDGLIRPSKRGPFG